jgi:predicted TIM-barrel fold metal-dependent hydrolase
MMFVPMLTPAQTPLVDHHQHIFSPANAEWSSTPSSPRQSVGAADIIALLDSAGIRRALVLSVAYQFGNPTRSVENEYEKVKAENDWTSAQVALYPDRLRAFCGVNPTRDYALQEIARCARDPNLRSGLKLHFGNSDVDLHDPHQLAQLKRVFRAANDNGMAIVVHMHASVNKKRPYGRAEAEIFLNDLLTSAPDMPVQIAHFAGAGTYDDSTDHAIAVFADAIDKRDPRTAHVYFDASLSGLRDMPEERKKLIVARIRQIGVDRILFGSDAPFPDIGPRAYWALFRTLPLSDVELLTIANNVAPYMR